MGETADILSDLVDHMKDNHLGINKIGVGELTKAPEAQKRRPGGLICVIIAERNYSQWVASADRGLAEIGV